MRILMVLLGAGLLFSGSALANTPEKADATAPKPPVAEASPAPAPVPAPAAGDASAAPAAPGASTAAAPAATTPTKPKFIPPAVVANVNLTTQKMTVSVNGKVQYTWAVSSGLPAFPTPRGKFTATWMSKMHYSKQYDDAPMPHSVFFKDGAAIHGTSATRALGRPASHGCVRLAPGNAATFYGLVQRYGITKTRVIVHGNLPAIRVASRSNRGSVTRVASRSRNYDEYSYSNRDRRSDRREQRANRDRRWPGESYAWTGSNRGPSWSRY